MLKHSVAFTHIYLRFLYILLFEKRNDIAKCLHDAFVNVVFCAKSTNTVQNAATYISPIF